MARMKMAAVSPWIWLAMAGLFVVPSGCDNEPAATTGGVPCATAADCSDPGPCLVATCAGGSCSIASQADGALCDDGDACTVEGVCQSGVCTPGAPLCKGDSTCVAGACVAPECAGATGLPGLPQMPETALAHGLVTADLNNDGYVDVIIGHWKNPNLTVLLNQGDGSFKAADYVADGGSSILPVDLTGDGKLDIVTTNAGQLVTVLVNKGDGAFGPAAQYALPGSAPSVTVVDLNGDAQLDLAVHAQNGAAGTLSALLNQGDGTFAAAVNYVVNAPDMIVTDLNGDQRPDILNFGPSYAAVSALLNQGDGTFAAPVDSAVTSGVDGLTLVNLNSDSIPDLVVKLHDSGIVSVLLGNGDGTFAAQADVAVGSGYSATEDLNGDGRPDLVVAQPQSDTVSVALNKGDGTFAVPVEHAVGSNPLLAAVADMNGDSARDLYVVNANDGTLSILLNNGDGTFASQVKCSEFGGLAPTPIDLNDDGKLDLALLFDNSISVAVNQGDGTFGAKITYPTGSWIEDSAMVDLNGDDRPDLVANIYGQGMSVLLNQGDASFGPAPLSTPPFQPSFMDWVAIVAADLNGDKRTDLAVMKGDVSGVSVLLGHGDGSFAEAVNYASSQFSDNGWPLAADVNGDGRTDLVTWNENGWISAILNQGNGTFASPVLLYSGSGFTYVAAADLNGDSRSDFVVTHGKVGVLWSQSDGSFAFEDQANSDGALLAVAAELNGDGVPDLVTAMYHPMELGGHYDDVRVLLGQGDGSFGAPIQGKMSYMESITSMVVADLDGDGKLDVAAAGEIDESDAIYTSVLLNQGDGQLAEAQLLRTGGATGGDLGFAADLNSDGAVDVVLAGEAGMVNVLFNQGNGTFAAPLAYPSAESYAASSLAVSDFNADGRVDVATVDIGFTGGVRILLNHCGL